MIMALNRQLARGDMIFNSNKEHALVAFYR